MHSEGIARVVIGLCAALALAVLAAHPWVKALERRFGVTVLISTGLPFLAMGAIFGLPRIGILTPEVLRDLQPAFEFGLGWIGFVVGMRFDIRKNEQLPRRLGGMIVLASMLPMTLTGVASTLLFSVIDMSTFWQASYLRDALVLAACAAPSAMAGLAYLSRSLGVRGTLLVREITIADDVATFALLGLIACLFRPTTEATRWILPGSAWLLVSLGLGGILGILTYALLRGTENASEELALLLGAVALSSGMAGYLALSPVVICAVAGALLANLPLRDAEGFTKVLQDVERPLYLIFLLFAGASWRPAEWQGWLVAPVFVAARVAGKYLSAAAIAGSGADEHLPPAGQLSRALMPQSPTSIVAIVSAATLYHDATRIRWGMNAVIIGGVLTELVARSFGVRMPRTTAEAMPIPDSAQIMLDALEPKPAAAATEEPPNEAAK
jgi:hypothetical protein